MSSSSFLLHSRIKNLDGFIYGRTGSSCHCIFTVSQHGVRCADALIFPNLDFCFPADDRAQFQRKLHEISGKVIANYDTLRRVLATPACGTTSLLEPTGHGSSPAQPRNATQRGALHQGPDDASHCLLTRAYKPTLTLITALY